MIRFHSAIKEASHWGIFLVAFGIFVALFAMIVDFEEYQSSRRFRAWQLVREYQESAPIGASYISSGHLADALEFLNRHFDGFVCDRDELREWLSIRWYSKVLTGNDRRACIFPKQERAVLSGINGASAQLPGVDLVGAMMPGADFNHVNMYRADLSDANLTGAVLSDGDFTDASFSNACLIGVDFSGSTLRGADFSGAYLIGVNFSGADLVGADLKGAYLTDDNIVKAVHRCNSKPFYLSRCIASTPALNGLGDFSVFASKCGGGTGVAGWDRIDMIGRVLLIKGVSPSFGHVDFSGAGGLTLGLVSETVCNPDSSFRPILSNELISGCTERVETRASFIGGILIRSGGSVETLVDGELP